MILGIFTGLLSPGGIERTGRHVGAVLVSYAKERGETCRLLSLNDQVGLHKLEVDGISFSIEGFNRNKIKFLVAIAVIAVNVRIVYVAHPNLAPLNILFWLFQSRSVVASHGIEVWEPLYWWRRLSLRFAAKVTAPSRETAHKLVTRQGLNFASIRIIPWALDPQFPPIANSDQALDIGLPLGKILLSVARLSAMEGYKGIDTVIRTMPILLDTFSDLHYVIAGDGDDRPRLRHLAKELGVDEHVIFIGTVSDRELLGYYQNCDIFVMPSKGEGFGLVFVEAMAFGKPVVGGKHAGTLDVIVEGETGLMVEYGNIPELAQCLLQLLNDELLRNRMGETGRRRANEIFSFKRFKKEIVDVINGEGD